MDGIDGKVVEIEAVEQPSLPKIVITGLPGEVIQESRERIRGCLCNLGFHLPTSRLVVHLSPAETKKQGSQFDIAIAIALLGAQGLLPPQRRSLAYLGELGLDGIVRRVSKAVPLLQALLADSRIERVLISSENALEAQLLADPRVSLVESFGEILGFLQGREELRPAALPPLVGERNMEGPSIDEVKGLRLAKRALLVALAGRHHLLMVGPPGVGKSLLASTTPRLLPPLAPTEAIEVAKLSPFPTAELFRPFRSPHHTASTSAFLGGGSGTVLPGEVTLANHGVLFMDEFPEFNARAIEGLREPLQSKRIFLNRVGHALELPADFILIAAMNPCPCGYSLSKGKNCTCRYEKALQYRKKISGPILDRIDLFTWISSHGEEAHSDLTEKRMQEKILSVWERRDKGSPPKVEANAESWFLQILKTQKISRRAQEKILRVAHTISLLEGEEAISKRSISEAWAMRCPNTLTDLGSSSMERSGSSSMGSVPAALVN